MRKLLLLSFLALLIMGCTGTEPRQRSISLAEAEMRAEDKGLKKKRQFQRRVEPGMTQEEIVKIASDIGEENWFPDGQPSNREFKMIDGKKIEVWEYDLYYKYMVMEFKGNSLVSMTTRDAETIYE